MDLEALRAQARAVATRMETRISTALGASRDLTAEEEAANTADETELADLKVKIAAAEQAAAGSADEEADPAAAAVTAAVTAERTRILALADLCPSSVLATPLRSAIEGGQDAGAFAIGIASASKARGASLQDLRDGAVQSDQLPTGKAPLPNKGKAKTGAEQAAGILAFAKSAGHRALASITPAS